MTGACVNCGEPAVRLDVCARCYRDPRRNACSSCGRPVRVQYPVVCGRCLRGERRAPRFERFGPAWWAAWTYDLHRPGRLDDEEIPDEIAARTVGCWEHLLPGERFERREPGPQNRAMDGARPDWPTMLHAQCSADAMPDDSCHVHEGRRAGTCRVEDG